MRLMGKAIQLRETLNKYNFKVDIARGYRKWYMDTNGTKDIDTSIMNHDRLGYGYRRNIYEKYNMVD